MPDSDPLLASLCAICNVNPHVYKCPRCAVLTCSLACVKRHKKWASCNGVRNPAAYVQITDLATPAGIDKDYNYLTSLERQLDNAEKDANSRGIQMQDEIINKSNMKKGMQSLHAGLEKSRAIIIRAPKGMSREKTNATRWLKGSQRLEWTVEWVHPDGRKELGQCIETSPILQVYEALRDMRLGTKRKHSSMQHGNGMKNKKQQQLDEFSSAGKEKGSIGSKVRPLGEALENGPGSASGDCKQSNNGHGSPQDQENAIQESGRSSFSSSSPSFFLHAPSLPTKTTVLIPLTPDARLQASLRERVVLEYPTIYVFKHGTDDALPEGFMLEDEFLKTARKDTIEELEDGEIGEPRRIDQREEKAPVGKVDEKKLLEVLGRDIGIGK